MNGASEQNIYRAAPPPRPGEASPKAALPSSAVSAACDRALDQMKIRISANSDFSSVLRRYSLDSPQGSPRETKKDTTVRAVLRRRHSVPCALQIAQKSPKSHQTAKELECESEVVLEMDVFDQIQQQNPSLLRTFGPIFITVFLAAFASGLIIPALALILERHGASALFNGISTMAVYIAFLVVSPFIAPLQHKYGPRLTLAWAIMIGAVILLGFPATSNQYAWIAFRLVFGACLSAAYVTTEIWLNKVLTDQSRGFWFASYGASFTSGLAVGPLFLGLVDYSESLPFLICSGLLVLSTFIVWRFSIDTAPEEESKKPGGLAAVWRVVRGAPLCMATAFVFGFLDGVINGDLPIWGSRIKLSTGQIAACMTSFMVGTIAMQIPLGILSDKWGRRKTLLASSIFGLITFVMIGRSTSWFAVLVALFVVMGASLGPFYSVGLAFLGDLVKGDDVTLANVLYMMAYGGGSVAGPFLVSALINIWGPNAFLWTSIGLLCIYMIVGGIEAFCDSWTSAPPHDTE